MACGRGDQSGRGDRNESLCRLEQRRADVDGGCGVLSSETGAVGLEGAGVGGLFDPLAYGADLSLCPVLSWAAALLGARRAVHACA